MPLLEPGTQSPAVKIASRREADRPAATPARLEVGGLPPTQAAAGLEQFSLLQMGPLLWRRKWIILAGTLLAGIAGLVYTLPKTPVYQAKTTLELQGLNQNFLNIKNVDPTEKPASYLDAPYFQTQIKILQSRTLLLRVIEKLGLEKRREFAPQASKEAAPDQDSVVRIENPAALATSKREQTLSAVTSRLSVKGGGQTRIIEISFDSIDPRLASDFVNTLAKEYIEQGLESRLRDGEQTASFLVGQLNDLKAKLEKSEDELQAYARSTGLMFSSHGTNADKQDQSVSEEKLREVQSELSKAQAERAVKQSQYEQAKKSPPEALGLVLNESILRDHQVKMSELRRQFAELNSVLTPEHPKMQRIQAQISELEPVVERARRDVMDRVVNEYEASVLREKILQAEFDKQKQVVSGEAANTVHYDILKRDVESNRQIYESMLQHVKEAGIVAAARPSSVRIIDAAPEPNKPYKPRPVETSGLSALFGLVLTSALVVMRERADRSLQEPGDATLYLKLPELGVIPSARAEASFRSAYQSASGGDAAELSAGPSRPVRTGPTIDLKPVPASMGPLEMVTRDSKASLMAEAFHATVTSVLLSGLTGTKSRVFVLTSPSPSEGKTTVTTNIAIAAAEANQKVLLIDGDMRRPRIHTIFKVDNESGLSTMLGGGGPVLQTLQAGIRATNIRGLSIVPSGPSTTRTHNLLYSSRTAELLRCCREEFDVVLIDTPPMLQMSDARVWAKFADAVILVVRSGRTTRDEALAARKRFADDGHPVLGVILNDWNPKIHGNKRYGYTYSENGKPSKQRGHGAT